MALDSKNCAPCRGGVPPLAITEVAPLLGELGQGWQVANGHELRKDYVFGDFRTALAFVNRFGALAEEQGHHPELLLAWGSVGVRLWTHKIDGLTESDFILAAKLDRLP